MTHGTITRAGNEPVADVRNSGKDASKGMDRESEEHLTLYGSSLAQMSIKSSYMYLHHSYQYVRLLLILCEF